MASGQCELGILRASITLDSSDRIHYGAGDVVTGNAVLEFQPRIRSHTVELFGPLVLEVVFQGRMMAIYRKGSPPDVVQLFRKATTIHDGPFRADPDTNYNFPFAMTFPVFADPRESIALTMNGREVDKSMSIQRHVTDVTIEGLPPALTSNLSKNDVKLMGPGSGSAYNVEVKYDISVDLQLPGIDVVIVRPTEETAVLYELPKVPLAIANALCQRRSVEIRASAQDESLVPEHARPQGLKGKAKAFLKPVDPPKYLFDVRFCDVPQHVFVGQQLILDLQVRGLPDISSVFEVPQISLAYCTVILIAHTASRDNVAAKDFVNHEVLMTKEASYIPPGPFSKEHEFRKHVKAGSLNSVPSSFTHAGTSRSYTLRFEFRLIVAEKTISLKRDFNVDVHPPCLDSSSLIGSHVPDDEQLPAYEQAVAGPSNTQPS